MNTPTEETIQKAIAEARAGNKEEARKALSRVVRQEPGNARAWYLLSQVVEKKEQAIYCLERVLRIQPDNEQAKQRIQKLQSEQEFKAAIEKPAIVASEISPKEEPSIATKKEILPIITDKTKKCPFCAEVIKEDAKVCRYCKRDLSVSRSIVSNQESGNSSIVIEGEAQDQFPVLRYIVALCGLGMIVGTFFSWIQITQGGRILESIIGLMTLPGIITFFIGGSIIASSLAKKKSLRGVKIAGNIATVALVPLCLISLWVQGNYEEPCFEDFFGSNNVCQNSNLGGGFSFSMTSLFLAIVIGVIASYMLRRKKKQ